MPFTVADRSFSTYNMATLRGFSRYAKLLTKRLLTFGISLDNRVAKFNDVVGPVIGDVFAKDHIFVEIACIEETGRKSDLLDIGIDMVFSLQKIVGQEPPHPQMKRTFVYLGDQSASRDLCRAWKRAPDKTLHASGI